MPLLQALGETPVDQDRMDALIDGLSVRGRTGQDREKPPLPSGGVALIPFFSAIDQGLTNV